MGQRRIGWTAGLVALALACASSPAADAPDASSASDGAATASAAPASPAPAPVADPRDPYAALRAELARQRAGGRSDPDPLAPLRAGLSRQVEEQLEDAYRGGEDRAVPAAPDPEGELVQLAAEIAEDARRREEMHQEMVDRVRRDLFAELERAPLRNCVPSSKSIADIEGDMVFHRKLRRSDFKARKMSDRPLEVKTRGEPGAHVAITILCVAGIRLAELGPNEFEARLTRLRFVALLDRDQSWWNRQGDHVSEEWTLRHEQVHFDLAEVEARRLNADRDHIIRTVHGRAATPQDAVRALQKRWEEYFVGVRDAFLEVERRYDRETRNGNDLDRQTDWFARAKRGLASTRPATGG